jgi:hypothetical protein
MNKLLLVSLLFAVASCETSEDISNALDHTVPDCKTLTIKANSQTKVIDDAIVTKELWGFMPTVNLQTVVLPTVSVTKGSTLNISVVISDNVALRTAELAYSAWLYSKYINFSNPEGDIPLKPESYTFTADIIVPADAVTTPWIETFTFNDGSTLKINQPYHKMTLTVVDVNMNKRILPIYVKVE